MQKIKEWKLLNNRPFVFGLAAMIVGIFLGFAFFVSYWFLVGFGIVFLAFLVAAISRGWFFCLGSFKTTVIIVIICFLLGLVSMTVREGVYRKNAAKDGVYSFTAKVVATTKYDNISYRTKIDGVELFDTETKESVKKLNESGYIWTKNDFEIGDRITFVGHYCAIEHDSVLNIAPSSAYVINVYSAVHIVGNNKTIFERYKSSVWETLSVNMSPSAAGTSFAMLCGDSSKVEGETKASYRAAGVGHILAVSGLHVGFFVLLLSFLFNALHVDKKIKFILITVLLIVYSWLCGFSYSVLRASIMCIVLLYSGLRGKQYDGLTAPCFATIIILGLIDPYQLFTVAFLLSFFSVFTIFCLYRWVECNVEKIYPKKFASSLAVGIVSSIAILPWQIYFFGYFCTFGIILNLIAIPLASVAFMLCFVAMPFVIIIPQLNFLLKAPNIVFFGIDEICRFTNQIPFSVIKASISPITIFFWYAAVVLCSDYIFLPKSAKLWTRIGSTAVAVLLLGLNIGGVF